jgi:hypothetical protein
MGRTSSIEGEIYIHRKLWAVVSRQIENATKNPRGAFYDHLAAMIFAFHTLEAYLNFIGEQLAPSIWRDERNFFRKEPYRGFDGKVRKILELCSITEPDRSNRPYSTIWCLKDLRDLIAHGKPEKFSYFVDHYADEEPSLYKEPFNDLVTHENAYYAVEDIKSFIEMIHSAAKALVNDEYFCSKALGAIFQHSTTANLRPHN